MPELPKPTRGAIMEPAGAPKAVNQRIFKLGLSVETISLYLLCCGMKESGMPISHPNLVQKWNSTEEALERSLGELASMNILQTENPATGVERMYVLTPDEDWLIH